MATTGCLSHPHAPGRWCSAIQFTQPSPDHVLGEPPLPLPRSSDALALLTLLRCGSQEPAWDLALGSPFLRAGCTDGSLGIAEFHSKAPSTHLPPRPALGLPACTPWGFSG